MLQHHHPEPVTPKRVVILGSAGFVARDLARLLQDQKVNHRAIGSSEIDLIQPESVEQLKMAIHEDDAVVITSALTPDKGRDVTTLMKNLEMARHLASFLETGRCSQVIYISSDAVYDGRESLIRESSPRQATDLYSLMHIAREQMLQHAAAKSGTPLCILCPTAIYGAGDTHNSYGPNRYFRTALKEGKISLFGEGEEMRDHVFIGDISRLISLCLHHRSAGVLNAATGETVSFHDVASKIADLCGSGVTLECLPRGSPVTHRHFDATERLKAFPNFIPTSLDEGLLDMRRQNKEESKN